MKSHTDIIDETLGVTDMVEIPKPELKAVIPKPSDKLDDIDADYKYQRENFYNLIEKGTNAIETTLSPTDVLTVSGTATALIPVLVCDTC